MVAVCKTKLMFFCCYAKFLHSVYKKVELDEVIVFFCLMSHVGLHPPCTGTDRGHPDPMLMLRIQRRPKPTKRSYVVFKLSDFGEISQSKPAWIKNTPLRYMFFSLLFCSNSMKAPGTSDIFQSIDSSQNSSEINSVRIHNTESWCLFFLSPFFSSWWSPWKDNNKNNFWFCLKNTCHFTILKRTCPHSVGESICTKILVLIHFR